MSEPTPLTNKLEIEALRSEIKLDHQKMDTFIDSQKEVSADIKATLEKYIIDDAETRREMYGKINKNSQDVARIKGIGSAFSVIVATILGWLGFK